MAEPPRQPGDNFGFDDQQAKRVENQRILFLNPQVKTEDLVALLTAIADDIHANEFSRRNKIEKQWLYYEQSEQTLQWSNTFSVNPLIDAVTDFTQGILTLADARQILAEAAVIILARFTNSLPSHWKAVLESFQDLRYVTTKLDTREKLHGAFEAIHDVLTEKEKEVKKPTADASVVLPEPYKGLLSDLDRQEAKYFDFPDARLEALSETEEQKRRKELHQQHLFQILSVLSGFTDLPEGAETITLSNYPTRVPHVRDLLNTWLYYSHEWAKNQVNYPQISLLENPQYFPTSKVNSLLIDLDGYAALSDKPALNYFGRVVRAWLEVLEKPLEEPAAGGVAAAEAEIEGGGDPEVIEETKRKKPEEKLTDEDVIINVADELAEAGFTYRLEAVRLQNFLLPQFLAAHGFEDVDGFLGSLTGADQSAVVDTFRREFLKELESTLRTLSSEDLQKMATPEGRASIRLLLARKLMYRLSANPQLVGAVQVIKEEYVTQQAQRTLDAAVQQRPELAQQDNSILLQQYRESARQGVHARAQSLEELVRYDNFTNPNQERELELLFPDSGAVGLEKLGNFQSYKQNLRGSITQLLQLGGFSAADEAFILTQLDVLLASKVSPDQLKLLNRQQFASFFGVQLPDGVSAKAYTGLLYCLSEYSQQRMVILSEQYGFSIGQTQYGTLDHYWTQIDRNLLDWLSDTPQQDIRRQLSMVLNHLSADDRQGLFEFLNNKQYDDAARKEFLAKLTEWVHQRQGDVDGVLPAWIQKALEHQRFLDQHRQTPKTQLDALAGDPDFYKNAAIAQAQTPQSLRFLADHPEYENIEGIFAGLHSDVENEWQRELIERLRNDPAEVARAMAAGVPLSRLSQYITDEEDVPDDANEDLKERKRQYLQLLADQIIREELEKERQLEHAQLVQDLVLAGADISYNNFADPNGGVQFNDQPADTRQLEQLPARSPLGGQDQPSAISRATNLARSGKRFVQNAQKGKKRLQQANMARKAAVQAGRLAAANPAATAGVGVMALVAGLIGALTQSIGAGIGAFIGGVGGGIVGFAVGGPVGAVVGAGIGAAAGGGAGFVIGGGSAGTISAGASSAASGLGSMLPSAAGGATAASTAASGTTASSLATSSTFLAGSGVAAIAGTAVLAVVNQSTLMGAFLPPLRSLDLSTGEESKYVIIEKQAVLSSGEQGNVANMNGEKKTITYSLYVQPKDNWTVNITELTDEFTITTNQETRAGATTPTLPGHTLNDALIYVGGEGGQASDITIQPGEKKKVLEYTVEIDSNFNDSSIRNSFKIFFTASQGDQVFEDQTAVTAHLICVGQCPQEDACWPVGGVVGDYFPFTANTTHKTSDAYDIAGNDKRAVIAPFSGEVCFYKDQYGNFAKCTSVDKNPSLQLVESCFGMHARLAAVADGQLQLFAFAHLSSMSGQHGTCQQIRKGEEIGKVGDTGNSTGPHLHFQMAAPGGNWYSEKRNSDLTDLMPKNPDGSAIRAGQTLPEEIVCKPL